MSRILTGIQSTNIPHLGNILGAVIPAINLSKDTHNESFLFIADLHTLTTQKNATFIKESTYAVAATWLAFGLDTNACHFYRQSKITEVCELAWYLSCFAPYPMLANAHSFKDKSSKLSEVKAGLFTYPILMAADILLYDAHKVPVGKDQLQHIEITRDIAQSINQHYNKPIFTIPDAVLENNVMVVPGIDGQKMSKSYNNFIDIFLPEKELKKVIMSIQTDSTPIEAPKNADTCLVFQLYKLLAVTNKTEELKNKYEAGGFGYGHVKTELYELILTKFEQQRKTFHQLISNKSALENLLKDGENKTKLVAQQKIKYLRDIIGY